MKLCRDVTRNEIEIRRGREERMEKAEKLGLVLAAIKANGKVIVA